MPRRRSPVRLCRFFRPEYRKQHCRKFCGSSSISTTAVSANYDGGSGTQEDPYQINSVDSLLTFASNVNDGSQGGYAGVSFKLTVIWTCLASSGLPSAT